MLLPHRFLLVLFLFVALGAPLAAQEKADGEERFNPHAVNPWISLPLTLGVGYLGQDRAYGVREKERTPVTEFATLDINDINGFDRWAVRQDVDPNDRKSTLFASDYLANVAHASPLALFIWRKYRRNWLDISLMYLEAQALQGAIYGYAPFGPTVTNRFRPIVYYENAIESTRTDGNARNSMFSGHVSTTTTSIYFVAKIIDDYNPDLTPGQHVLLYAGATVPAALSAYLRIRALKHFPTDTLVGMGVGAISGIGVPELHRWWAKRHPRSSAMLVPMYGNGAAGAGFTLTF